MQAYQPTPTHDAELIAAAGHFFPGAEAIEPIPGFPHQVVVTAEGGAWAVRRWAPETTARTVEWIADGLLLARAADADLVPAPAPLPDGRRALLHAGHIYDAVTWPGGRPLNRYGTFAFANDDTMNLPLPDSMAAPEALEQAVRALAQVHTATLEHAARPEAPVFTLGAMLKTAEAAYARLRKSVGRHAGGNQEIRRWLRCGNRVLPAADVRLADASNVATARTCLVHADPWPSRLLVEDREGKPFLVGVTGWQQAAAGSPVLDLARLAARCARWSAATAETVVGVYVDTAPLPPEQRRLLPVVAAIDLTMATGLMLQAAYDDDRIANDPVQSFVRSGIQTSLRSLETLANVLEPESQRELRARSYPRRPTGGRVDRPRRRNE